MNKVESRRTFLKKSGSAGLSLMVLPGSIIPEKPVICASNIRILPSKNRFRAALWGDPQIAYGPDGYSFNQYGSGTPDARFHAIWKNVNPQLSEGVKRTNALQPDFIISLGDTIHGYGEHEHYGLFKEIVRGKHELFTNEPLAAPLLFLGGNHDHWNESYELNPDSPYKKRFYPRKADAEYANYIAFLEEMKAPVHINYSFDMGAWHFILLSQMAGGVDAQFEKHPGYLDWLRKDLSANRNKPTVFCSHHPIMPQGSRHFDSYGPSSKYRRIFHDILKEHGNVKYAFFGHVHNTIHSITNISWKYDGICYITIPNIAHTTRKHDFYEYREFEGDTQGLLTIDFDGQKAGNFRFTTLGGQTYSFQPGKLPVYRDELYGYLKPEWTWRPHPGGLQNGDFVKPLKGSWYQSHTINYGAMNIPHNADYPLFKKEIRKDPESGNPYLYMYNRAWVSSNGAAHLVCDVRQAVRAFHNPVLRLTYRVFEDELQHPDYVCPFLILSGYKKNQANPEWVLFYNIGARGGELKEQDFGDTSMSAFYRQCRNKKEIFLKRTTGSWEIVTRNIARDFKTLFNTPWKEQSADTLILTLGNFCTPMKEKGVPAEIGTGFTDVAWEEEMPATGS